MHPIELSKNESPPPLPLLFQSYGPDLDTQKLENLYKSFPLLSIGLWS